MCAQRSLAGDNTQYLSKTSCISHRKGGSVTFNSQSPHCQIGAAMMQDSTIVDDWPVILREASEHRLSTNLRAKYLIGAMIVCR